jgi:hypothetical protein
MSSVTNLELERELTRRIVTLLMAGKQHKQIAHIIGCSLGHIVQVKYRYLREQITMVLTPEGETLLAAQQLKLPFPKQKRGYNRSCTSLILRRLGR